jgi:hypothetical protein
MTVNPASSECIYCTVSLKANIGAIVLVVRIATIDRIAVRENIWVFIKYP